jgi:hypothetical protein
LTFYKPRYDKNEPTNGRLPANLVMAPTIIPATARATNISALLAMNDAIPLRKLVIAVTIEVTTLVNELAMLL